MKTKFCILSVLLLAGCWQSSDTFTFEAFDTMQVSNSPNQFEAFHALAPTLSCPVIPTLQEVEQGQWKYTDKFYSLNEALQLNIQVVNASASRDLKIYVKDYVRQKSCLATDGETTVNYGQVIRTVIEIEKWDASMGIDLPAIAANGTLGRTRQNFYLYKDGFYNPQIDQIIASISGKVFDVQNYALYQNLMPQMLTILNQPQTTFSVNIIGIEKPVVDDTNLVDAPIIAYTLFQIMKDKKCDDVKLKFNNNQNAIGVIEETYRQLGASCDASSPTEEVKLKAKRLLQGLKVRG